MRPGSQVARTERTITATPTLAPQRGDEAELYARHHRALVRTVSHVVNASHELIEDACQNAWTSLLRHQPERAHVFSWLRVVAIHEAYSLSRTERRPMHLEDLDAATNWGTVMADGCSIDDAIEARWALRIVAELPDQQRKDLTLLVAGFSYREIADMTNGRTYTNVNKHIAKARAHIRRSRERSTQGPDPVLVPLHGRDAK